VGEERLDWTNGIGHVSSRHALIQDTIREVQRPPTPTPLQNTQPLHTQRPPKVLTARGQDGKGLQSASVEVMSMEETVSAPWTPPEEGNGEGTLRSPFNDSTTGLAMDEGEEGQAEVWRRPQDSPNDPPPDEVLPVMHLSQLLSSLVLPSSDGEEQQQRGERQETQAKGEGSEGRSVLLKAMRTRVHVSSAFKILRATMAPPPVTNAKVLAKREAERPSTVPRSLRVHASAKPLVSKAATEIRFWLRPYEYRNVRNKTISSDSNGIYLTYGYSHVKMILSRM
jgi:hypothetical protein